MHTKNFKHRKFCRPEQSSPLKTLNFNSLKVEISFFRFFQNFDFTHSWFLHKEGDILDVILHNR